jgi:uncharacterized protein YbbC (DUF1343 family)
VILMTNRVHPTRGTSVVSLRGRVASVVAASLDEDGPGATGETLTGLDVLQRDRFRALGGKRVGLITNHTGVDRRGRRNVEILARAENVRLAAIFTPEHGLDGDLDQARIADAAEAGTGVPIYSLFQGERRRPQPEMLQNLDALVFDIQDVGARFYTYASTMAYAMEEAAKAGLKFYVLDRPNPIGGERVEGPLLDRELRSFVGYFPMPVRHGMTVGELARLFNDANGIGADLEVIEMEGWRRSMWFDETGLSWMDPSPNMRTLQQALLYPGVALLEGLRNYSVGRGTDTPFEFVGADWMDARRLAAELNRRKIGGVRFYPLERTPQVSVFAGTRISGVQIVVTDRDELDSGRLGLEIADALLRTHPGKVDLSQSLRLIGDRETLQQLEAGEETARILERWKREAAVFLAQRERALLYRQAGSDEKEKGP